MVTQAAELTGYLSPSKAAARLGVSEATLRNWATRGRLPVLLTPHGRLYAEADIERMTAREVTNGQSAR